MCLISTAAAVGMLEVSSHGKRGSGSTAEGQGKNKRTWCSAVVDAFPQQVAHSSMQCFHPVNSWHSIRSALAAQL
jgi:hypothetical protein